MRPGWRFFYALAVVMVALVALGLRLKAVAQLPIDYDEDDYLAAGQRYAQAIRNHNLNQVIDYTYNYEHPPLTKLIYGLAFLPFPNPPLIPELDSSASPAASLPEPQFRIARTIAAMLDTLEALALALLNPLAGLLLAINTWQIKYTSQVMLESLPALMSLLTALLYLKSNRKWNAWLCLSALTLGITAASKYTYCIVGVAILSDWLYATFPGRREVLSQMRRWVMPVLLWGSLAVLTFFVFDPHLWHAPFSRLEETIFYHASYAQSAHVKQAGYPVWQPLVWLAGSVPWHPGVFIFSLDLFISIFAVLGLPRLWKRERVLALWLVMALAFLLAWPTKWPQYILVLTAPLSLAASEGLAAFVWRPGLARLQELRRQGFRITFTLPSASAMRQLRRAAPWLLPGTLALILITLYPLLFQLAMSLTDFSSTSILDGLRGGVWREVWRGLTAQVKAAPLAFSQGGSKQVHFAGAQLLFQLISTSGADILVFEGLWTILSVGLQVMLGVGLAWILNHPKLWLQGWWRSLFILPWAIPEFVGALMWGQIYDPNYGWSVAVANMAHHPEFAVGHWQTVADKALPLLLLAGLWYGFPLMLLAASAGLKSIPREVSEAAQLDGAGPRQLFRWITWPMLAPLLLPAILLRAIYAFNQFYLFYVLQTRPPVTSLALVSYQVFNQGAFAVSASVNVLTLLLLVTLLIGFNRLTQAAEGVTYV